MAKPTLTYFPVRGRVQFPRCLLEYLGEEYNFNEVKAITDDLKKQLLFKQIPLYQEGDFKIVQTSAIVDYISEKHDFRGKTKEERARAHQCFAGIMEVLENCLHYSFKMDKQQQEKFRNENPIKKIFDGLEIILSQNKYLASGEKETYADLMAFVIVDYVTNLGIMPSGDYSKLICLKKHYESSPQLKKYLESRSQSQV
ncbi:hypothetical protein RB653_001497 [Dictyostelium firmibasis]|uniref:Glutathione transferase n=1 Tax=Dictyostelium firmibasis TaxID=79012 RepID=A0AAN7YRH0_9MYCE